jgi:maltokinase
MTHGAEPPSIWLPASEALLDDVRRAWPPATPADGRGYAGAPLGSAEAEAALDLGAGRAVVVLRYADGARSALPCRSDAGGWRVAVAGDGAAARLLRLGPAGGATPALPPQPFRLARLRATGPSAQGEQDLGTDQTNRSVIVGGHTIVKWRSSRAATGGRAIRLRRHLALVGFEATPPLVGWLGWRDATGVEHVLADVDGFLPAAEDGWDHLIAGLSTAATAGSPDGTGMARLGSILGSIVGSLHAALATASGLITHPRRAASATELAAMHAGALAVLAETVAIEATDQLALMAAGPRLRALIERMPRDWTMLQPIHGDLHIGQLVAWRGGFVLIDFDGPPMPSEPAGDENATARDLAQLAISLWNLAAAADVRGQGTRTEWLGAWAATAEASLLDAYRATVTSSGAPADLFDERLLEPLMAEHLCRELVYAARTLPRWRYAPMWTLRERYGAP